jgi:histidinol phosphatase-like PHP family hydrolase/predicted ATPase
MSPQNIPGSHYRKIDLHIHTPQSKDYKTPGVTARDIVDAAISAGLDAIAVTDHNDYRFIDSVKEAANGTGLVVFPGVEISTRDGHLIAILDPDKVGRDIHTLLIACGLRDESEYGEQNTICMSAIEEVAKIVVECGGLAIAAHVDGPKGFLETVGVGEARKRIYADKAIMAIELTDSTKKEDWLEGRIYPKARACLQGSDAHGLEFIGRRSTWVRVANINIAGLRQALNDPKARIRFVEEYDPKIGRSFIEKLHISQGFFGKQEISFNPGLNCIIGGQGVGKSAIIEFIRFALGSASKIGAIEEDHRGKLDTLLKPGGTVSVIFCKSDNTRYEISRTFDGNDNPSVIRKLADDGTATEYPLPEVQRYFQILAYSQNEAINVARDSVRQLELIDAHLDLSSEINNQSELQRQLKENTRDLKQIDSKAEDLEDLNKRKTSLQVNIDLLEKSLRAIEATKNVPAIRDNQSWLDEERFLKALKDSRDQIKNDLLGAIEAIDIDAFEIPLPDTNLGHEDELKKVWELNKSVNQFLQQLKEDIDHRFDEIRTQSLTAAPNWLAGFSNHKKDYAEASQKLANVQVNSLQTQLHNNKGALGKLDNQIREAKALIERKKLLLSKRGEILNQLESERQRVSEKRNRHAKAMSATLNKRVLISVKANGNKSTYIDWLANRLDGRSVKRHHIEGVVNVYSPRQLANALRNNNYKQLAIDAEISETAATSIYMMFKQNSDLLYELEHVITDDLPDIRMRLKDDSYRPLDQLSTGQKFTVIILLALTDDDKPIVYDQPEDALDTALIFTDIAQLLRRAKDNRQFIFATHNANISVAADLDLAVVISGSATEARIDLAGGIEDSEVRGSLIEYLEGGTEAVEYRMGKYGL